MSPKILTAFVMLPLLFGLPALAQEIYDDVEYISGKDSFEEKIKGRLVVDGDKIIFADKRGRPLFTVPMNTVTSVSNSIEEDPGSFGKKLVLGIFASKKEEFLYVNTETAEKAEAIVFKCKKKTSPGIVAKIRFYLKEEEPSDVGSEVGSTPVAAKAAPSEPQAVGGEKVSAGALPPAKPAEGDAISAGALPPKPLEAPSFVSKKVGWTTRDKASVGYEWEVVLENPNSKAVQMVVVLQLHGKNGEVIHRIAEKVSGCVPGETTTIAGTGQVEEAIALQADHWTFDVTEVAESANP
jgi:hypothetical protein